MKLSFVSPTAFAFGYHISSPFKSKIEEHSGYSRLQGVINITHLAGYIPMLGIISGIVLLFLLITKPWPIAHDDYAGFRNVELIRACAQLLGYGFLFLIPDIITTLGREFSISKENYCPRHT
jgi:hypothetical protein